MLYKNLDKNHRGYFDFSNLTETDKAYWAGLLDGEGCLRLEKSATGLYPHVALHMTCEETVHDFQKTFDTMPVHTRSRNKMKEHWKDCYGTKAVTHKAAKLCEALLPYFRTKKDIAKELAEFYLESCECCNEKFWSYNGHKTCSQECTKLRKNMQDREYRLKKKSLD